MSFSPSTKLDLEELNDELELASIDLDFFKDADFDPTGANDQGRLDRKNPIRCPACGHEFNP